MTCYRLDELNKELNQPHSCEYRRPKFFNAACGITSRFLEILYTILIIKAGYVRDIYAELRQKFD